MPKPGIQAVYLFKEKLTIVGSAFLDASPFFLVCAFK
jgi:hypothetical protein